MWSVKRRELCRQVFTMVTQLLLQARIDHQFTRYRMKPHSHWTFYLILSNRESNPWIFYIRTACCTFFHFCQALCLPWRRERDEAFSHYASLCVHCRGTLFGEASVRAAWGVCHSCMRRLTELHEPETFNRAASGVWQSFMKRLTELHEPSDRAA